MNEALAIDPDCALAYLVRAQGYSYLNNQAEVENNLKKAIGIQPDFKDALLQLGRMKLSTENYDEAKEFFLKVIEVEPGNREASDGLKMIEQNSKNLK
ncbi:MAG: hypothetical protein IPL53_13050 [Ignavibacteria bacterium]|nr:hypothetical protein [Ignavibacteria bacterium]